MSEDFDDQAAGASAAKPARKKPAPRKVAKTATTKSVAAVVEAPLETQAVVTPEASAPRVRRETIRPEREVSPEREPREGREARESREPNDFRDAGGGPIPFFVDGSAQDSSPSSKKRRRRKKKSGQGHGQSSPLERSGGGEAFASQPADAVAAAASQPTANQPSGARTRVDPDLLAIKAWKIFQAEVAEEGLALIDDHDAREISRRCFRLAEIFLDEAARRGR